MTDQNVVYAAVSPITEEREASGSYSGNGHHFAQEITTAVCKALDDVENTDASDSQEEGTIYVTELKVCVHPEDSEKKRWIITRCDMDPEVVGEVTAVGVPARAKDLPEGSVYRTTFIVP